MAETETPLKPPEAEEENDSSEESEGDDTAEGKPTKQKKEKDVIFTEIPEEDEEEDAVSLNLLERNTASFRCLAQITMSSSSLMNQRLRFFPPIPDPGLDDALSYLRMIFYVSLQYLCFAYYSKTECHCKTTIYI